MVRLLFKDESALDEECDVVPDGIPDWCIAKVTELIPFRNRDMFDDERMGATKAMLLFKGENHFVTAVKTETGWEIFDNIKEKEADKWSKRITKQYNNSIVVAVLYTNDETPAKRHPNRFSKWENNQCLADACTAFLLQLPSTLWTTMTPSPEATVLNVVKNLATQETMCRTEKDAKACHLKLSGNDSGAHAHQCVANIEREFIDSIKRGSAFNPIRFKTSRHTFKDGNEALRLDDNVIKATIFPIVSIE